MTHLTLQDQRYDKRIEQERGGIKVNEQAVAVSLGHSPELDCKTIAEVIIHSGYRA